MARQNETSGHWARPSPLFIYGRMTLWLAKQALLRREIGTFTNQKGHFYKAKRALLKSQKRSSDHSIDYQWVAIRAKKIFKKGILGSADYLLTMRATLMPRAEGWPRR